MDQRPCRVRKGARRPLLHPRAFMRLCPPFQPRIPHGGQTREALCYIAVSFKRVCPPYVLASITSSRLRSPVRGALTSTAIFPGGCSFFHIFWCASGIFAHGKTSLMHG